MIYVTLFPLIFYIFYIIIYIENEKRKKNMDIKEQIINALRESDINFDSLCEEEHDIVEEYLTHTIVDTKLSFDSGISKLVIFVQGEPFVIKIPYTKLFDDESYNSDLSYWENEDSEEYPEPEREEYYQNFEFATSLEVETTSNWDYCELECAFYEKAYEEGLAQYFAKEELYAIVKNHPIYIQEKVTPLEFQKAAFDNNSFKKFDSTRQRCSDLKVKCFSSRWITDFFDYYGEQEFIKLSNFLEKMKIYDLHEGNLGYYCGAPVLIDYSDFREW